MFKRLIYKIVVVEVALLGFQPIRAEVNTPPTITVVYPLEDAHIGASDSTFIFGQVTPGSSLTINGTQVQVYHNGAFLAFLPLTPGNFVFNLEAQNKFGTTARQVRVKVPFPIISLPLDTLRIAGFFRPTDDLEVTAGDLITVSFRGTPDCMAFFRIENLTGNIPMTESPSDSIGDSTDIFAAATAKPASKIRGIYHGVYTAQANDSIESGKIVFTLIRPTVAQGDSLYRFLQNNSWPGRYLDTLCFSTCVYDTAPGRVTIRNDQTPRIVELTDSVQILRTGPGLGYLAIFQPRSIRAVYTGRMGVWVRLYLAEGQTAWTNQANVRLLPLGTPPPRSSVSYIRVEEDTACLMISLPLALCLPYRIDQDIESRSLKLTVYGLTSNVNWIRQNLNTPIIQSIVWNQPQSNLFTLEVVLNIDQLWGYDAWYNGTTLIWQIKKPPPAYKLCPDLVFTIDPGHSADKGAVGPTGLEERQANLWIAQQVAELLRREGATVVMTRTGMEDVPLYARPQIAKRAGTHIFISIHNNALPDGTNPFYNNGTSVYYYHPHSRVLAKAIHNRLVNGTGLNDQGLYYANFAVNRPTQYLAVLVECAFMMIPEQEELLATADFQKKVARLIVAGVKDFLKSLKLPK